MIAFEFHGIENHEHHGIDLRVVLVVAYGLYVGHNSQRFTNNGRTMWNSNLNRLDCILPPTGLKSCDPSICCVLAHAHDPEGISVTLIICIRASSQKNHVERHSDIRIEVSKGKHGLVER